MAAKAKPNRKIRTLRIITISLLCAVVLAAFLFSLPIFLKLSIKSEEVATPKLLANVDQFPVTVDPKNKTINESWLVNTLIESDNSPFQARVGSIFQKSFEWLATTIGKLPLYKSLASANSAIKGKASGGFVTITPGMRKEQVVDAFGDVLGWTTYERQQFVTPQISATLPLKEGSFAPGVYFVNVGTTPAQAQAAVNNRFTKDVLARYGTSTAEIVPLKQALTIASLIQREAGRNDMRLISGIIWNRIFSDMNLQLDATLQYAKANKSPYGSWWPNIVPADKYQSSAYNTYQNPGLPPNPIANPSVAAIVAALNPLKTPCLFYFHDKTGTIHCSEEYGEHVAQLKEFYGRGK